MGKSVKTICIVLFCLIGLTTCEQTKSPKAITKAALEEIKKKDYEKALFIFLGESEDKETKEVVALLSSKMTGSNQVDEIKSFRIIEETISGDTAVVEAKVTYADGTEKNETFKYVKDEKGKWRLDIKLK